jgi:UDP-GlcNAc:undecaprenyl-phosphate/decaprenyl-phosphate GlcNAc-1-phosphate transferase
MQNIMLLMAVFSFGVALMSWPLAKYVGVKFDVMDYPNQRKIHTAPTLCTGGLLILLGYLSGLSLCWTCSYPLHPAIMLSIILLFTLGILGDKHQYGIILRLIIHTAIACIPVFVLGLVIKNTGLFGIPLYLQAAFTIFAIVGVINAFNIIDGMNGLASGLGITIASALGVLSFFNGDEEVFILAILLAGALSGFMILNLSGKIFMGDSGSYLTGFLIAILSIMLAVRNPEVSPFALILFVLVPIFDTLFAVWRRIKLKRNPFIADKRHLHHILARRYQSKTRAVIVIILLQAGIAMFAILFYRQTLALMCGVFLFTLFLRRLWFRRIKLGRLGL